MKSTSMLAAVARTGKIGVGLVAIAAGRTQQEVCMRAILARLMTQPIRRTGGGARSASPVLRASLRCVALEARESPTSGVAHTGLYGFIDPASQQPVLA